MASRRQARIRRRRWRRRGFRQSATCAAYSGLTRTSRARYRGLQPRQERIRVRPIPTASATSTASGRERRRRNWLGRDDEVAGNRPEKEQRQAAAASTIAAPPNRRRPVQSQTPSATSRRATNPPAPGNAPASGARGRRAPRRIASWRPPDGGGVRRLTGGAGRRRRPPAAGIARPQRDEERDARRQAVRRPRPGREQRDGRIRQAGQAVARRHSSRMNAVTTAASARVRSPGTTAGATARTASGRIASRSTQPETAPSLNKPSAADQRNAAHPGGERARRRRKSVARDDNGAARQETAWTTGWQTSSLERPEIEAHDVRQREVLPAERQTTPANTAAPSTTARPRAAHVERVRSGAAHEHQPPRDDNHLRQQCNISQVEGREDSRAVPPPAPARPRAADARISRGANHRRREADHRGRSRIRNRDETVDGHTDSAPRRRAGRLLIDAAIASPRGAKQNHNGSAGQHQRERGDAGEGARPRCRGPPDLARRASARAIRGPAGRRGSRSRSGTCDCRSTLPHIAAEVPIWQ